MGCARTSKRSQQLLLVCLSFWVFQFLLFLSELIILFVCLILLLGSLVDGMVAWLVGLILFLVLTACHTQVCRSMDGPESPRRSPVEPLSHLRCLGRPSALRTGEVNSGTGEVNSGLAVKLSAIIPKINNTVTFYVYLVNDD